MAMDPAEVERLIKAALPDAQVEVGRFGEDNDHLSARVVSPSFKGMPRVRQHQLVYGALQGRVGGQLHALQLTTAAE